MVPIPDSLRLGKKSPVDDRMGVWEANAFRPFNSINEANTLTLTAERYLGMTLLVKLTNNITREYWYRDGVLNADLIPKNNWEYLASSADGNFLLPAGNFINGFVIKPTGGNLTAFKIGTTIGGDEISGPAQAILVNQSLPVLVPIFADSDITFYFSGIGGILTNIIILKQ